MLGCFRDINIQVEALCSGFEAELCMFGIDVGPRSTVTLCNRVFHGLFSGFYNGEVLQRQEIVATKLCAPIKPHEPS